MADDFLIVQRLCESFKKVNDEGKDFMTVEEFIYLSNFQGMSSNEVLKLLEKHGVEKGFIEMNKGVIKQTQLGIDECSRRSTSFGSQGKPEAT